MSARLVRSFGLPGLAALAALVTTTRSARADEARALPGVTAEATFTGDEVGVVGGGVRRGAAFLDNAELSLALDLAQLASWRGAALFVDVLGNQGADPSALAGDVQTVDGITAPASVKLYEAWLEQVGLGGRASILVGLYDVSSEFDHLSSAQIFLNASQGTGAELARSGESGPSIFPFAALAVRAKARLAPQLVAEAVVADAVAGELAEPAEPQVVPEGAFVLAEVDWLRGLTVKKGANAIARERAARRRRATHEGVTAYRTKVAVGTWAYTNARPDLLPEASGRPVLHELEHGTYGEIDTRVYSEPSHPLQGLSVYARAGFADPRVDRVAAYTGGGVVYTGPFPGRGADRAGAAVAVAYPSARLGPTARPEVDVELTYLARVTRWFDAQLDFQYVESPNLDPSIPSAVVVATRCELAF